MYFETKVVERNGRKKMMFNLHQISSMIGQYVTPTFNDDCVDTDEGVYVSIHWFRNHTERKHDWLYRKMARHKNKAKFIHTMKVSIHFMERWTERKPSPFNFKNLKQEIMTSRYIGYIDNARGYDVLRNKEKIRERNGSANIYYNEYTNTAYVLDGENKNLLTVWQPPRELYDETMESHLKYEEVLKTLEDLRDHYYTNKETLSVMEMYSMRNQIGTLCKCLLHQNINGMYTQIVDINSKLCG